MQKNSLIIALSILILFSCDTSNLNLSASGLTTAEIVDGLKTALVTGSDSTTRTLSKPGGYLNDLVLKILLPTEVQQFKSTFISYVGQSTYDASLKSLEDKLITSINSSAEDAAKTAFPVFKSAILSMSITDAVNILKGGSDTAATNYLRNSTFAKLKAAYAPKMDSSLNKPLFQSISANSVWSTYTSTYNSSVDVYNAAAPYLNKPTIGKIQNQTLGEYATQKALEGLFIKIKDQEKLIRQDPYKYVSDIIKKVFDKANW